MYLDDADLQKLSKAEIIDAYLDIKSSRDRLFSITSHDLRSPFSGLLGLSEMLAVSSDDISKDELRKYLTTMRDSIKNTYQLLENLFEWGQLERDKCNRTIEKIPLKIVLEEIVESLESQIASKEMKIIHSYDDEQIIETNSKMFEFVLKNLISNAVKFSRRGGEIEINFSFDKEKSVISVKDFGIGISKENIAKLFSTKTSWKIHGTEGENGTGLGLLVSFLFAEFFGAGIEVESTPGEGSTFMLILPESRV